MQSSLDETIALENEKFKPSDVSELKDGLIECIQNVSNNEDFIQNRSYAQHLGPNKFSSSKKLLEIIFDINNTDKVMKVFNKLLFILCKSYEIFYFRKLNFCFLKPGSVNNR